MNKTKILMVCLGNICRSPLAEGILKSKVNLAHFEIDSAGTGHWHVGEQPDPRSVAVGKKFGIDISTQRARQFKPVDFDHFDIIYVMDASNYKNVIALATTNTAKKKVKRLLEENPASSVKDVPDPYYGGDDGFENVYYLIDDACNEIVKNLKTNE